MSATFEILQHHPFIRRYFLRMPSVHPEQSGTIGVKPLRKHGSDVSIVVNTFALSGLTKNMDRDAYTSSVGYESDQNHMDHHQIDPRVPTINF